jgi:hypothetical protein
MVVHVSGAHRRIVENRGRNWGEMIDFATDIYARKQDKKMS